MGSYFCASPKPGLSEGSRRRVPFARIWFAVTLAALAPVLLASGLFAYEQYRWRGDPDAEIFETVCSRCHSPARPHRYAKSPGEWEKTVERMLAKEPDYGADIDKETREKIVALLIRQRSADGKRLFRLRCGRCHDAGVIEEYPLPERGLKLLVERHVLDNNFAVATWEGGLILEHLQGRRPRSHEGGSSRAAQDLFEDRCGVCHTIRFRYKTMFREKRSDTEWAETVRRMREKAPDFIREEEMPTLIRHILMMRDTEKTVP